MAKTLKTSIKEQCKTKRETLIWILWNLRYTEWHAVCHSPQSAYMAVWLISYGWMVQWERARANPEVSCERMAAESGGALSVTGDRLQAVKPVVVCSPARSVLCQSIKCVRQYIQYTILIWNQFNAILRLFTATSSSIFILTESVHYEYDEISIGHFLSYNRIN